MRVGQIEYTSDSKIELRGKEIAILHEIGFSEAPTATSFVAYLCEKYGLSKSGIWYCLKKLKSEDVLEFTEKGEEFKPLRLTQKGVGLFRSLMPQRRIEGVREMRVNTL